MEVDRALSQLGSWGKWQVIYFLVLSFSVMFPAGWHMVAIVYIGYKPEHHCKMEPEAILNQSVPFENDKPSSCEIFSSPESSNTTEACPNGWEYLGNDGPTIVTQWDLVCDKGFWAQTTQTILVTGVMIGAVFFTSLSDTFGRKPIFLLSQWGIVLMGLLSAFSPNYYIFCISRFFTGAFQQGIILTGFVMACELFAAKQRTFAGTIIEIFWASAWSVFPLMAYLFKNWFHLQLFISLVGLLTVPLYWYLPESVIWLTANGKTKKAETIIRNASKMNKIELPDPILIDKFVDLDKIDDKDGKKNIRTQVKNTIDKMNVFKKKPALSSAHYTILDLIRSRKLCLYAIIMSLLWMIVTLVYYGLSLSTAQLAGNRYLNGFFNGVVEIPAYVSCYFILNRFGRRHSLIGYQIIAGLGLLANAYFDRPGPDKAKNLNWIILFNMIGKFGITGSFAIVFLYAPEIFPTTLRNQAMGIASLFGRFGNLCATYASYALEKNPSLVVVSLGLMSIVGGLMVLYLPETHNRPLPQTLEDIEAWDKTRISPISSDTTKIPHEKENKDFEIDVLN